MPLFAGNGVTVKKQVPQTGIQMPGNLEAQGIVPAGHRVLQSMGVSMLRSDSDNDIFFAILKELEWLSN